MKNADYWKRRFELLEGAQHKAAGRAKASIEHEFDKARRDIDSQIRAWYGRFAENNQISLADARKLLNGKELAELKWDIVDYIKYGKENAINGRWMKELENASARFHVSRLEALKLQTRQTAERLYGKQHDVVGGLLKQIYLDSYYNTAFEVQRGTGVGHLMAGINEDALGKVLSKPWTVDGKTFSGRIWTRRDQLVDEVHTQLVQGMILNRGPDVAIKAIAKKFEASKANAGRLVMTESAYFASLAEHDAYKELGVEQFEVLGTLDSVTCALCGSMDGKVFKIGEFGAGVSAPPYHPFCRCTIVPYFDDETGERIARGEYGGQYNAPQDMTYEEWKELYINKARTKVDVFSPRGIINTGVNNSKDNRFVEGSRQSSNTILSDSEIEKLKGYIAEIKADESVFRFNQGRRTGLSDKDKLIYVRGDVYPDLNSTHPRDLLSEKAVLAHEYYGHYMFYPSSYSVMDWRDEMRASYIAAIKTPSLSEQDRKYLILDAYERAREAGHYFSYSKKAKEIIYGYK